MDRCVGMEEAGSKGNRVVGGWVCAVLGLAMVPGLAACDEAATGPDATIACEVETQFFAPPPREIDILVVIDTSPSMAGEQAALAVDLPRWVSVLESLEGGLPSLHLGVISADLGTADSSVPGCSATGDGGRLQSNPMIEGCVQPAGAYLASIERPWWMCSSSPSIPCRWKNYEGSLGDAFACIGALGADGCQYSQPLEAMKRALDGSVAENDGFLRDDAFLLIVIVTDQDDCSANDDALFDPSNAALGPSTTFRCAEYGVRCDGGNIGRDPAFYELCEPRVDSYFRSPRAYADLLKSVKRDPSLVMVSVVSGAESPFSVELSTGSEPVLSPVCSANGAEATPAVRLRDFAKAFPARNEVVSICGSDYSDAFVHLGALSPVLGYFCLGDIDPTDLDSNEPGVQLECVVTATIDGDPFSERIVPQCDMAEASRPNLTTPLPCWWAHATGEVSGDCTFMPRIESGGALPRGTGLSIRCKGLCE